MATFRSDINPPSSSSSSSYITPSTTTTSGTVNVAYESPKFCDIKIICTKRKKKRKGYIYLTFVDSHLLISGDDQPCIEILSKTKSPSILLNDCISFEYFDPIKNDHQSYIYIYFESNTISIYFPDEHLEKKSIIIKHLESMSQSQDDKFKKLSNQPSEPDLPCITPTTNHILHTFDIKLIPYENIITRDHQLVGPARLYFTTTDLYIASRDCNRLKLKTTIANQCPTNTDDILCIPYFTIKHYGNRSNIFLIELGKSNYGNGEIHMKCFSSSLASTIHLLVSPVIEERPLTFSSAFRDRFLTRKRVEKSRSINPPIQLNSNPSNSLVQLTKRHSVDPSLSGQSVTKKPRSFFNLFRKFTQNTNIVDQSYPSDSQTNTPQFDIQPFANKYFALNVDERKRLQEENSIQSTESSMTNNESSLGSTDLLDTNLEHYVHMGPIAQKSERNPVEIIKNEGGTQQATTTTTTEIGINTVISLSPQVYSAIVVGTSAHSLAEERAFYPIGPRSFTFPTSVMQPFKAQLDGQSSISNVSNPEPSSLYHSTSPSDPHQTILLSYGIVTFDNNSSLNNQTDYVSDGYVSTCRINSDASLMSITRTEPLSAKRSLDNILSSSTSSHIFRTVSFSTNNVCDNISGRIRNSNASILVYDENFPEQIMAAAAATTTTSTTYLLDPPSMIMIDELIPNAIPLSQQSTQQIDDAYAMHEPLAVQISSFSSPTTFSINPMFPNENSIHYTDILLTHNLGDEQQDYSSSSSSNPLTEEKSERTKTFFYTNIDYQQTQRRHHFAQFAELSKLNDRLPPFVL